MSLIHWWPLTGHAQDMVGNKHGELVGSPSLTETGKIGYCYSTNTTNTYKSGQGVNVPNCNLINELGSEYSFACWFKVHGTHPDYNGTIMSSGNWNTQCWAVGISKDNTQIDVFCDHYNQWLPIGYTLSNNVWYHLVSAQKNGVNYVYLNGELLGTRNSTALYRTDYSNLCIGRETYAGGYFGFNGDINDIRVYNHCLSPREVKLLAQGLIAHYKMSGIHMDNLIPGGGFAGTNSWTGGKIDWSVSAAGDVASLKLDKGTNVASTPIAVQPILGHKYYGRELIKTNGNVSATDCRFELFAGDGPGLNWVFGYNSGNYRDWTINSGIITVDQLNGTNYIIRSFVVNSTNTVWIDDVVLIDLTTAFGKGNEPSKEWCDQNIPQHYGFGVYNFIPNTTDSSGYNNNLNISSQTIGGTSTAGHGLLSNCLSADSIKYRNCTKFNVLENKFFTYNTRNDSFPDSITSGTISGWIKLNTYPSSNTVVFADYHSDIAFGFWGEQNAIIRCSNKGDATRTIINLKSKWDTNKWHHIAVTRDNNTFTFYLDGQEWSSIGGVYDNTSPNYWTHNYGALTLGARHSGSSVGDTAKFELPFSGLMSDVRMHVTPLTATAIKELYQSCIAFLDNGTLQCSEIIEKNKTKLYYNGIVGTEKIDEIGKIMSMETKQIKNKAAWLRVNMLDLTTSQDCFNDTTALKCTDQENRFSMMGEINKLRSDKVTIKNLLPSFSSNYKKDWSTSGYVSTDRTYSLAGGTYDSSLKIPGQSNLTETTISVRDNKQFTYIKNHKYYVRSSVYSEVGGHTHDVYIMAINDNGLCYRVTSAAGRWVTASAIYQSTAFETQTAKVRLDFNNSKSTASMWLDGLIIIDLTESFGEGNEPSKEWCDQNIEYFTSTYSRTLTVEPGHGDFEFVMLYNGPSEYEFLNYIRSTGTQYIDTQFKPNGNTKIRSKLYLNGPYSAYGAGRGYTNLTSNSTSSYLYYDGYSENGGQGASSNIQNLYGGGLSTGVITQDKHTWHYDDNNSSGSFSYNANYTAPGNLFLFGRNDGAGNLDDAGGEVTIYWFEIYDNGTLIRNFIPARRKSDSTLGLYDTINNQFYTNKGSGTFVGYDADAWHLPYNHWRQSNSPNVAPNCGTGFQKNITHYNLYCSPLTKSNSYSQSEYSANTTNNWWAPICQKTPYNGGIPAADGTTKKKVELWVKVPDITKLRDLDKIKLYGDTIHTPQIYEL